MKNFDKKKEEYIHLVKHFWEQKAVVPLFNYWMKLNQANAAGLIDREWEEAIPYSAIREFIGTSIDEIAGRFIDLFREFEKKIDWKGNFIDEEIIQLLQSRSELENMWLVFNEENKSTLKQDYSCDLSRVDTEFRLLVKKNSTSFNKATQSVHEEMYVFFPKHWWWRVEEI